MCFCQSKAFTVCQNNQWLLRCSFNSLLLQNKRTCSCGFSAHISISACWSKAFLSVHVKLIGIFAQYVGFCQCRIVLEHNGARSGNCCGPKATPIAWKSCFWTAAHPQHRGCVLAVQHDTCCPSKWKEMDASGMPFSCGGQRCPCCDCCGNVNLRRKLLAVDKQRLGLPFLSARLRETCFPFCGECRALQSRTPRRGCSLLCFCTSPPRELLRLPGKRCLIPQAGTGMICASGSPRFSRRAAPRCLPCRATDLQPQPDPPSQRLAPQAPSPQHSHYGRKGLQYEGCQTQPRENQLETLPEKSAIAQHHWEQNIHAAFYMLACKLQCK